MNEPYLKPGWAFVALAGALTAAAAVAAYPALGLLALPVLLWLGRSARWF